MKSIELAVVGIHYRVTPATRHKITRDLNGAPFKVKFVREPDNVMDENAIKVVLDEPPYKGLHIGYLQRSVSEVYAGRIDSGEIVNVHGWLTDVEVDDIGAGEGRVSFRFEHRRKPAKKKTKAKR